MGFGIGSLIGVVGLTLTVTVNVIVGLVLAVVPATVCAVAVFHPA